MTHPLSGDESENIPRGKHLLCRAVFAGRIEVSFSYIILSRNQKKSGAAYP
jgi:hypothetical protein